ncbi:tRNA pseudouridine(38-40) synthase TruA [Ferruginibacter lapsinanis]|uniref:tRNA pseudouridine(38-40) synthase TruA n=1 Tax=Ferruginibacter lapsinanis TaxID=563172 RepID=UPI001E44BD40|nr:tRNA pseudouridine(38-40) synthase TruA [Ferruginibacter lapsinanis]UEG51267.1 tRNA pseudouridine(38-40) synthase TruA [Ferruginibacter lapsinanis]
MARYFIEVSYNGSNYAGFQIQQNANSIQSEVEKALKVFFKEDFQLTGSSRTDAGVHAIQNYFHFDSNMLPVEDLLERIVYNINAILPDDIVVKAIRKVKDDAHCRFDAIERVYRYYVYRTKNPFVADRAYYYPYKLDLISLQQAATALLEYEDFTSFSKKNTQVKTFNCKLTRSFWAEEDNMLIYTVSGNRFLRGMVRGLVGTMLKVGTQKITLDDFKQIILSKDCSKADFSVPPQGLFLEQVLY